MTVTSSYSIKINVGNYDSVDVFKSITATIEDSANVESESKKLDVLTKNLLIESASTILNELNRKPVTANWKEILTKNNISSI